MTGSLITHKARGQQHSLFAMIGGAAMPQIRRREGKGLRPSRGRATGERSADLRAAHPNGVEFQHRLRIDGSQRGGVAQPTLAWENQTRDSDPQFWTVMTGITSPSRGGQSRGAEFPDTPQGFVGSPIDEQSNGVAAPNMHYLNPRASSRPLDPANR
jgi:hypothetical protein